MRSSLVITALMIGMTCEVASAQVLLEARKLFPNDAAAGDQFGRAVSAAGHLGVVGSVFDDNADINAGAAYVFDLRTGQQIHKLIAPNATFGDTAGSAVSILDNTVLVGAPQESSIGTFSGATYAFQTDTGLPIATLLPFPASRVIGSAMGWGVAHSEQFVCVGAPGDVTRNNGAGAAYLYDTQDLTLIAKVFAGDPDFADNFGYRVAVEGSTVVIAAPFDNERGLDAGAIYVFDAATGAELRKIAPSDASPEDFFGFAISIQSGLIAASSAWDDDNGANSGSVYLFDAITGDQLGKFLPNDGEAGDQFGRSVAVFGDHLVVGAPGDDNGGTDAGALYAFSIASGGQLAKLVASDAQAGDFLGLATATSGSLVLAAAEGDDDKGNLAGAAYVFDLAALSCPADLTGEGDVNTNDFFLFLSLYQAMDPRADFAPGGGININDFFAFLAAYQAGC